jgi:predicted amidohydrolase
MWHRESNAMTDKKRQVRIASIQQGPRVDDFDANVADLLNSIDEAACGQVDFIVATELSLTPYFCFEKNAPEYRKWAQPLESEVVGSIAAKARQHHATIILPFFRRDIAGQRFFNSAAVIGPDGQIISGELPGGGRVQCYDKVHLPKVHAETLKIDETPHFERGQSFPVFTTEKARIGILICYDRRFPEAWRTLALSGAEIVFVSGCIPAWELTTAASSAEMFIAELRTRAMENSIDLVACNRAGFEDFGANRSLFFGESCVIGPAGTVIARGLANAPCIVRATVDLNELEEMRKRLPLFMDRRPDLYLSEGVL